MSVEVFWAACADLPASSRTSCATTANPFPAAPAPGGLHRRVQRQYVGLERDVLYGLKDLSDLIRAVLDLAHRLHERLHLLIAQRNFLARMMCLTAECHSAVRRLLCLIRDLRDL